MSLFDDDVSGIDWDEDYPRPGLLPSELVRAENPCRVYWGSHGCNFERGHDGHCECCCSCRDHKHLPPDHDDNPGCVGRFPYYGPDTRFYGEDVESRGLPQVDSP